jgi:molecular chaperone DnaK (HSP70)
MLTRYSTGFNDAQRRAVVNAGTYAGLNVLRVIIEPVAAALGYGLDKRGGEQHVLVYDLGGSTLDATLLFIDDGVFEVLAIISNLHLGGADFDERVVDYLVKSFRSKSGIDVTSNLALSASYSEKRNTQSVRCLSRNGRRSRLGRSRAASTFRKR